MLTKKELERLAVIRRVQKRELKQRVAAELLALSTRQMPIVVPEHDLVLVFTGWNILPGRPSLRHREAIDCVVSAIVDRSN